MRKTEMSKTEERRRAVRRQRRVEKQQIQKKIRNVLNESGEYTKLFPGRYLSEAAYAEYIM